jgi:hypothetical protein
MNAILHSRAQVHKEDAEARQLTLIAELTRRNPHVMERAIFIRRDEIFLPPPTAMLVPLEHLPLHQMVSGNCLARSSTEIVVNTV